MAHLFISYAHSDADFVALLKIQLEQSGLEVWLDDERLRAGEDWREGIDSALRSAFAVILVLSPDADSSKYVTYEWACAWGAEISIVPILLKETDIHPRLETLQYLDFTIRQNRPWDKLTELLLDMRTKKTSLSVPIPKDAPKDIRKAVMALDSWNEVERYKAIEMLAESGHPTSTEALVNAINYSSRPDVRIFSIWYLAYRNSDLAIQYLIPLALGDVSDPEIHNQAIKRLPKTVAHKFDSFHDMWSDMVDEPALFSKFRTTRGRFSLSIVSVVRVVALRTLALFNTFDATELLILLNDEDILIKESAIELFGAISFEGSISPLLDLATDINDKDNIPLRTRAIDALAKISSKDATVIDRLVDILKVELNETVITSLIKTMGILKANQSLDTLIHILSTSKNHVVIQEVIRTLGQIDDQRTLPHLAEQLESNDIGVVTDVIKTLPQFSDKQTVADILVSAIGKEEWYLKSNLRRGRTDSIMTDDQRIRELIAQQLVQVKEYVVNPLTAILNDDQEKPFWWWYVKNIVVEVLQEISTPEALDAVSEWQQNKTKNDGEE